MRRLSLRIRVFTTTFALLPLLAVVGRTESRSGIRETTPIQLRRAETTTLPGPGVLNGTSAGASSGQTFQGQSFPARRSLGAMLLLKPTDPLAPVSENPVRLEPVIEPVEFQQELTTVQDALDEEIPPAPSTNRPPGVKIPYNFLDSMDNPEPNLEEPGKLASPPGTVSDPARHGGTDCLPQPPPSDCGCPGMPRGLLARPPKLPGLSPR